MHIVCFIILSVEELYQQFVYRSWQRFKFSLDSLSFVALGFYVCGLFITTPFYEECKQQNVVNMLIIRWIKIEWAVFLANMCGLIVFLSLKAVASRIGAKFQNRFTSSKRIQLGDTLAMYAPNATQIQIAFVNLICTIYVRNYQTAKHKHQLSQSVCIATAAGQLLFLVQRNFLDFRQ